MEGKNEYLKDYEMSGQEKTKNGRKYGNHFRKGLRGMFTRQLDICFYIVNKVVKQDIKNDKDLG